MITIFLVEDNPADVDLFRMALEDACLQCDLVLFEDGRKVIDYIDNGNSAVSQPVPDLLVLDLNLPKNDGLEILQIIRRTASFANVPVLVLSSSSSVRERAKLTSFKIREFMAKPSDLDGYLQIGQVVRGLLSPAGSRNGSSTTTSAD
jgi:chemotaxis family two-component system response regulator Rcp1